MAALRIPSASECHEPCPSPRNAGGVAADIRKMFNAPDRSTAEFYLKQTVQKYEQSASRLAGWLKTNLFEGLTVFAIPETYRRILWQSTAWND